MAYEYTYTQGGRGFLNYKNMSINIDHIVFFEIKHLGSMSDDDKQWQLEVVVTSGHCIEISEPQTKEHILNERQKVTKAIVEWRSFGGSRNPE